MKGRHDLGQFRRAESPTCTYMENTDGYGWEQMGTEATDHPPYDSVQLRTTPYRFALGIDFRTMCHDSAATIKEGAKT